MAEEQGLVDNLVQLLEQEILSKMISYLIYSCVLLELKDHY